MSRKHAMTLIEVMISLTLMTFLLGGLFSGYRLLTANKREVEQLKRPYVEERYVWQRLEQIIPKAQAPFFTADGLVFRFDRGVYPDPRLSDLVLGKLYLDSRRKTLCLGIWPDPLNEEGILTTPSQTLTLLDHVDSIKFHFYSAPDPFQKIVDPEEIGKPHPQQGWENTDWLPEYNSLPAFVKLTMTRLEHERTFTFDLNQPIIYPVEGL